jgi:hypothetical protein
MPAPPGQGAQSKALTEGERLLPGTMAEQAATILLPNSVAQGGTRWHRIDGRLAETRINRPYLIQGDTD